MENKSKVIEIGLILLILGFLYANGAFDKFLPKRVGSTVEKSQKEEKPAETPPPRRANGLKEIREGIRAMPY